jgi:tRNA pseudouridine38-40 synthase
MSYDGKPFRGFAPQPVVKTVAGDLRMALNQIFGVSPDITCAGRTDAGVHAWGQVVHFDLPKTAFVPVGPDRLHQSLNRMLSPSIVIRHVAIVDTNFDARFSAKSRLYYYSVFNSEVPSPFMADRAWWVAEPLDFDAMNYACKAVLGEHDFSSFCRRPDDQKSLVRNVKRADWFDPEPNVLRFEIEANAFCHQMVRSLTGMFVAIGARRKQVSDMEYVLNELSREHASPLAPPQGLCLWEVFY